MRPSQTTLSFPFSFPLFVFALLFVYTFIIAAGWFTCQYIFDILNVLQMKAKEKSKHYAQQLPQGSFTVRSEDPVSYGQAIRAEQLRKMVTGKSKTLSIRINPTLLALVDQTLSQTEEFKSRNELIEVLLLRYLEMKGRL